MTKPCGRSGALRGSPECWSRVRRLRGAWESCGFRCLSAAYRRAWGGVGTLGSGEGSKEQDEGKRESKEKGKVDEEVDESEEEFPNSFRFKRE